MSLRINLYVRNKTSPFIAIICTAVLFGFSVITVNNVQASTATAKTVADPKETKSKNDAVSSSPQKPSKAVHTQPTVPKQKPKIIYHPDGSKSIEIDENTWVPLNATIGEDGKLTIGH